MERYKVKFDEDGKVCPTDPRILKRNPMCANFIQYDKMPFNPVSPHSQLPLKKLGIIPEKLPPKTLDPEEFKLKKIGDGYYTEVLPQDYTNQNIPLHGRKLINFEGQQIYQSIPRINQFDIDAPYEDIFEPPKNVTFDKVNPNPNPFKQEVRNIGEIELQPINVIQSRLPRPRQMTNEELIEAIIDT